MSGACRVLPSVAGFCRVLCFFFFFNFSNFGFEWFQVGGKGGVEGAYRGADSIFRGFPFLFRALFWCLTAMLLSSFLHCEG